MRVIIDGSNRFLEFNKVSAAMTLIYRLALATFVGSLISWSPTVFAQSNGQELLVYDVDLSNAKNHYVTIEAQIVPTGDQTELMMAVWTPGSYLVREFSRHIDSISVQDEKAKPVDFEKTRKNRWTVDSRNVSRLRVKYRIYCNELAVRTNFVDGEFAVLNGAPTFLTVPEYRAEAHKVQLNLPGKWKRSATSLESAQQAHTYVAKSFDELVDSPIVAGNITVYPFEVSAVPHQLVNVGESGYWNGALASADLKKMVKAQQDMWGNVPYKRYLFLNVICGRGGGLEHDNSTVIMTSTWSFRDKKRYKDWLSLASHEFFHTWNVRRLRPKALVKYDYENEVYTPSLWIAEGVTSYYQDVLLARAGLITADEYLEQLGDNIESVKTRPGRLLQSLKESSYDTWIKFYRNSSNSSDTQISYYSKGAVVGFLLDAEIRQRTGGEKSLDDVMRVMFERFSNDGYLPSDFRQVVDEVAGVKLAEFFNKYVDSTDELDFVSALDWFGLRFKDDKESKLDSKDENVQPSDKLTDQEQTTGSDAESADLTQEGVTENEEQAEEEEEEEEEQKAWLGFRVSDGKVINVEVNSPASEIGLNRGDELLAINGFRVRGDIDKRLKQFKVGDELTLLVSRRNRISTFHITIDAKEKSPSWDLKRLSNPSEEQTNRLNHWLGIDQQ